MFALHEIQSPFIYGRLSQSEIDINSYTLLERIKSKADVRHVFENLTHETSDGYITVRIAQTMYEYGYRPMPYYDYFVDVYPYLLAHTPEGEHLVRNIDFLYLLEGDISQIRGAEILRNLANLTVRVPYVGENFYIKLNGEIGRAPYELIGMQALKHAGMHVVTPLVATQWRIVTLEDNGEQPRFNSDLDLKRDKFYDAAKSVFRQVFNGDSIDIGTTRFILGALYLPDHLLIRDLESDNPLDWFTVIDAIEVDQGY